MLKDSCDTMAVNRCMKLSIKAAPCKSLYVSHSSLAEPYTYLLIEVYDGNVRNDVKLKQQRNPSIDRTNSYDRKTHSMN